MVVPALFLSTWLITGELIDQWPYSRKLMSNGILLQYSMSMKTLLTGLGRGGGQGTRDALVKNATGRSICWQTGIGLTLTSHLIQSKALFKAFSNDLE